MLRALVDDDENVIRAVVPWALETRVGCIVNYARNGSDVMVPRA